MRVLQARAQLGIAVGEIFPQTQQAIGSVQYYRTSDRAASAALSSGSARVLAVADRGPGHLGARLLGTDPARHRIGRRQPARDARGLRQHARHADRGRGQHLHRAPDRRGAHPHRPGEHRHPGADPEDRRGPVQVRHGDPAGRRAGPDGALEHPRDAPDPRDAAAPGAGRPQRAARHAPERPRRSAGRSVRDPGLAAPGHRGHSGRSAAPPAGHPERRAAGGRAVRPDRSGQGRSPPRLLPDRQSGPPLDRSGDLQAQRHVPLGQPPGPDRPLRAVEHPQLRADHATTSACRTRTSSSCCSPISRSVLAAQQDVEDNLAAFLRSAGPGRSPGQERHVQPVGGSTWPSCSTGRA